MCFALVWHLFLLEIASFGEPLTPTQPLTKTIIYFLRCGFIPKTSKAIRKYRFVQDTDDTKGYVGICRVQNTQNKDIYTTPWLMH